MYWTHFWLSQVHWIHICWFFWLMLWPWPIISQRMWSARSSLWTFLPSWMLSWRVRWHFIVYLVFMSSFWPRFTEADYKKPPECSVLFTGLDYQICQDKKSNFWKQKSTPCWSLPSEPHAFVFLGTVSSSGCSEHACASPSDGAKSSRVSGVSRVSGALVSRALLCTTSEERVKVLCRC